MYVQYKTGLPVLLYSVSENMNYHWRPMQLPIATTEEFQVSIFLALKATNAVF